MSATLAEQTFTFGQRVVNPWASETNPTRYGFFVETFTHNRATLYRCTDRKGNFWLCVEIHALEPNSNNQREHHKKHPSNEGI